ncbi:hypothetical protein SBV42_03605 [Chlamydia crocodili]|uniref:Uncharacterized protein n=1 Tax=Chlamydia crocodili TaxID=2766982 RepID=A0ABX8CCW0_9CHLA|nr:hypothetical protein [Chlamydia crocodili]QVE48849.1 hypothetical protein H9Q19_03975 [Chlamydia crocodili]
MCFPGFPNIPGFSFTFQRTTENETDENQPGTSNQSVPLVTQQPTSTQSKSKTKTEVKISFGGGNNEENEEGGVEGTAAQIQTIVETTQHIIHNPQVQKGCMVCYDHCSGPCIDRCGWFGSWFCACFKACCILETPMDTNIPDIMRDMDKRYGPLSLAMAVQHLGWDVPDMVKRGHDVSTEDEKNLEDECKKAKKQLTGSFNQLSQQCFYDKSVDILDDENLEHVLPTLLKIIGDQAWKDPKHKPNPPKCWVLEPAAKTDSTSPTSVPLQLDLRRPSLFPQSEINENYDRATATKYDKKKMTKCLANLDVLSLETGAVGTLGAKEAHLVITIFELFLCLVAGEHSPLVLSGGCVCYDINKFIKLLMLILLCCGYVPVDKDGDTVVKHDDDTDPFVKIYKRSLCSYTQKQQATAPATTEKPLGAVGGAITHQPIAFPLGTSRSSHISVRTIVSTTSTTSTDGSSRSQRRTLQRQHSIHNPVDDYQPGDDDDWLKKMIDGNDDDDDDDTDIFQQRMLIGSSNGLKDIFAAMQKFNNGI